MPFWERVNPLKQSLSLPPRKVYPATWLHSSGCDPGLRNKETLYALPYTDVSICRATRAMTKMAA